MIGNRLTWFVTVAVAAVAAACSIPANASDEQAGSSCSDPIVVTVRSSELRKPSPGQLHRVFNKGPLRVSFGKWQDSSSIGAAPSTKSSKWRSCEARGTDSAGTRWRIPAPVRRSGLRSGEPSAVGRLFGSPNVGVASFSIARIAPADGRSCARPYTVIRFIETEFTDGDKHYASLAVQNSGSASRPTTTVTWAARSQAVLCEFGAIVSGHTMLRTGGTGGTMTFPRYKLKALWVSVRGANG